MKSVPIYAVLGGDARMRYLAQALCAAGCKVQTVAVPGLPDSGELTDILPQAKTVILPVPALDRDGNISGLSIPPDTLLSLLPADAAVCGGKLGAAFSGYPNAEDCLKWESLTIRNAILTAEGAVQIAMTLLPSSVQDGRFLVVGAGRIGMALARKLKALGADVTVSARKAADFARIEGESLRCDRTGHYETDLGQYEAVFNTVPAQTFTAEQICRFNLTALYLELASAPGGLDDAGRVLLGERHIPAGGLPGRCAPKTAGELLVKEILARVEEKERSS